MSKCNSEIGWLTKQLIPTKMATSLLVEKNLAVIACLTKKFRTMAACDKMTWIRENLQQLKYNFINLKELIFFPSDLWRPGKTKSKIPLLENFSWFFEKCLICEFNVGIVPKGISVCSWMCNWIKIKDKWLKRNHLTPTQTIIAYLWQRCFTSIITDIWKPFIP